jgi:hypothetical protein
MVSSSEEDSISLVFRIGQTLQQTLFLMVSIARRFAAKVAGTSRTSFLQ